MLWFVGCECATCLSRTPFLTQIFPSFSSFLLYVQAFLPAQYVEYFVLGIMGITGLVKLVASKGMAKDFWFVPKWSWALVGLYELLTVYYMHVKNDYAAAAPLIYAFFGAVIYCISRAGMIFVAPFPLFTVVCTWSTALKHGADTSSHIVPYMGLGFVATVALCTVFGAAAPAAKKAKSA